MPVTKRSGVGASLCVVLLVTGLGMSVSTVVLHHRSEAYYYQGVDYRRTQASWRRAAEAFENAARAYVPHSPYPERALRQLTVMARRAEMSGDEVAARYLWECVRRAVLSVRHLSIPNDSYLERAERRLVVLHSRTDEGDYSQMPAVSVDERPRDPAWAGSLVLGVGFFLWVVGAGCFFVLTDSRSRLVSVALSCLGLMMWGVSSIVL